jgi:hypothetical protein
MKIRFAKLLFSFFVLACVSFLPEAEAGGYITCVNECTSQNCSPDDQMCGQWCQEMCICQYYPQYCN